MIDIKRKIENENIHISDWEEDIIQITFECQELGMIMIKIENQYRVYTMERGKSQHILAQLSNREQAIQLIYIYIKCCYRPINTWSPKIRNQIESLHNIEEILTLMHKLQLDLYFSMDKQEKNKFFVNTKELSFSYISDNNNRFNYYKSQSIIDLFSMLYPYLYYLKNARILIKELKINDSFFENQIRVFLITNNTIDDHLPIDGCYDGDLLWILRKKAEQQSFKQETKQNIFQQFIKKIFKN